MIELAECLSEGEKQEQGAEDSRAYDRCPSALGYEIGNDGPADAKIEKRRSTAVIAAELDAARRPALGLRIEGTHLVRLAFKLPRAVSPCFMRRWAIRS
ncbi:hypothetical protein [Bosea vestrisii]|uniref:Uncharacterized protein n=1 Tax=Bosea vestrisii TaxID=151416 RepID=A0ABW0HFQ5_9HYPH